MVDTDRDLGDPESYETIMSRLKREAFVRELSTVYRYVHICSYELFCLVDASPLGH